MKQYWKVLQRNIKNLAELFQTEEKVSNLNVVLFIKNNFVK